MTTTRSMDGDNLQLPKRFRSKSFPPSSPAGTIGKQSRKPLGAISGSAMNSTSNKRDSSRDRLSSPLGSKRKAHDEEIVVSPSKRKSISRRKSSIKRPSQIGIKKQSPVPTKVTQPGQPVTPSIRANQPIDLEKFKALPPPREGDRFRVFYDQSDDMFDEARRGARGWYFGTVKTVKLQRAKDKPPYRLHISFDNEKIGNVSIFDYPDNQTCSVERLIPSSEGSNLLMGELTGDFAGDKNPHRLDIGDLVFAQYQQLGRWYRGRVAATSESDRTCDIAYDDNEYECGVPLRQNVITLIEDGRAFKSWMNGLKMTFPLSTSGRRADVIIKVIEDDDDMVELEHSNGAVEKQSYGRVLSELFSQVKARATTVIRWDGFVIRQENPTELSKDSQAEKKTAQPVQRIARRRKTLQSETMGARSDACIPRDFDVDPWMSDWSDEDSESDGEKEEESPLAEISNSLRNTLWKAMNSKEAHYGEGTLRTLTTFHNVLPNDQLSRELVELLWKGPVCQRVQFPDCVRTELANDYFDLLKPKKGMASKLATALPSNFTRDFLEQVETPDVIYCVKGDERRLTSAAVTRVGQTLVVKNSGASLFCYVLQNQLKGYSRFGKRQTTQKESDQDVDKFRTCLGSRAMIGDIIRTAGSAQTLKDAVRATFSTLIYYGHYLSSDFCFPSPPLLQSTLTDPIPPHATLADQTFVRAEIKSLLKSMGRICGYLAWLYSIEQGKSLYAARYLIRDAVEALIASTTFNPSNFLNTKTAGSLKQHWADMKLKFALSFDRRITGRLGEYVAMELNVPSRYF